MSQKPAIKNSIIGGNLLDDDDEDLRIFANESLFNNMVLDKLNEKVTRHIHFLKYADISKRVDSLVSINEMIVSMDQESQPVMMKAANELIGAIVFVLNESFDKPVDEINVRFTKYFVSVVVKICSSQVIMQ